MARRTPIVNQVLDEYMTTRLHLAENTTLNDRSVLNGFVRSLGAMQIGNVTPQHVERYFIGEQGIYHRMNAASYNKVRQRVELFLEFCARRGYNKRSLLDNVKPRPVMKVDRLRLSPSQMLDMIEQTRDPRDRAMLAFAVNTALRAAELTSVQIRDVDLRNESFRIAITKSHREDHMPMSSDLTPVIRRWLIEYEHEVRRQLDPNDYLFPARQAPTTLRLSGSGGASVKTGQLKPASRMTHPARVVQDAIKRIGVEIKAGEGFHTIRRSSGRAFFDLCADLGHDEALRMTSSFLHHSSSQVTELYLGLQHERVKRDDMLRGKPFLTALVDRSNVVRMAGSSNA